MKTLLIVFLFFLIAFAGLGAGLLLRRRGLRGGCQPAGNTDAECRCRSEAAAAMPSAVREVGREIEELQEGGHPEDCPTCAGDRKNART